MDKNLYHANFPVSQIMFPNIEQLEFKNKSWEFHTVCTAQSLHDNLLNGKFIVTEQYRWSLKKGYSDMELWFFLNLRYYTEINDIAIKLINYWGKLFIWVIEWIDASWHFLQVEPFPCLTNQEYLNQLILLWNQKHLYIHIYSDREIVKTIVMPNLFRRDSKIEEVLKKLDISAIESNNLDQEKVKELMKMCVETLWKDAIQEIANQSWVFFELA